MYSKILKCCQCKKFSLIKIQTFIQLRILVWQIAVHQWNVFNLKRAGMVLPWRIGKNPSCKICQVIFKRYVSVIVQKYVNQIRQIPSQLQKTSFYFPIVRQQNKICQMKMCEYLCKVGILDNLWHNDDTLAQNFRQALYSY